MIMNICKLILRSFRSENFIYYRKWLLLNIFDNIWFIFYFFRSPLSFLLISISFLQKNLVTIYHEYYFKLFLLWFWFHKHNINKNISQFKTYTCRCLYMFTAIIHTHGSLHTYIYIYMFMYYNMCKKQYDTV